MLIHPAWRTILAPKLPRVKLLDVKSDTSDTNVYTFSACNLGDLGSVATLVDDVLGVHSHLRSSGRRGIAVCVHGKDDATTFGVSGVTIGGVAGVELVDRGGGTSAINSAIYLWNTNALQGIANTDIAVTWTESILTCAIGVLLIENIGLLDQVQGSSGVGTGVVNLANGNSFTGFDLYSFVIFAATCITGGGAETFQATADGTLSSSNLVQTCRTTNLLYDESNAEMAFAAGWAVSAHYAANNVTIRLQASWSGGDAGDFVGMSFV